MARVTREEIDHLVKVCREEVESASAGLDHLAVSKYALVALADDLKAAQEENTKMVTLLGEYDADVPECGPPICDGNCDRMKRKRRTEAVLTDRGEAHGVLMTVSELIVDLKYYPGHLLVRSEGCDCEGDASGTVYKVDDEGGEEYVLVRRKGRE